MTTNTPDTLPDPDGYKGLRELVRVWSFEKAHGCPRDHHPEMAAVAALLAERDALRADAERYRWLRARPLDDDEIYIAVDSDKVPGRWGLGGSDPRGCDAAIDAARKESQDGQ